MNVEVKILFFAKAKEITGTNSGVLFVASPITYQQLLDQIVATYSLKSIQGNIILALNENYCGTNSSIELKPGDEIAVIPPLSGEKISVEEITNLVTSPSCGAISVFMGTTRDNFEGKPVIKLEYEAYESMGLKAFKEICNDIRERWNSVDSIAIYHRLGVVPVNEASIVIAISSPHREEAIKATEFCINNVKKLAPIWKKEVYANSKSQWKENKESSPYPPKRKRLRFDFKQKVDVPYAPPYLIQVNASKPEVDERIKKFMERKRKEIDSNNIREFCGGDRNSEFTCARIDAVLQKRKDSKSHLQVNRVLNSYQHRDQANSDYLKKFIPANGIEERLQNLECQLSLTTAVPKNIYSRLKSLEDRLLYLESVSPEYLQFWDKTSPIKTFRKKIYTIEEIEDLIFETEKKIKPV